MKLSNRLQMMIEEHDIDEGEAITTVMLDPDSNLEDMREVIFTFLSAITEDNSPGDLVLYLFTDNNLLEDDDDDDDDFDQDDDEDSLESMYGDEDTSTLTTGIDREDDSLLESEGVSQIDMVDAFTGEDNEEI